MKCAVLTAAAWLACLCCASSSSAAALNSNKGAAAASCAAVVEAGEPAVPFTGVPGSARERSFFAIKPDGLQRGLVGEVLSRFERKGWKLVGLKMVTAGRPLVELHYEEHAGKDFFDKLVSYICSGPIVVMVWEGNNVIAGGRKMLGATNPLDAEKGTIRGDFCTNAGRNLVHASDGPESAEREISLWFRPEETSHWGRSTDPWISQNL